MNTPRITLGVKKEEEGREETWKAGIELVGRACMSEWFSVVRFSVVRFSVVRFSVSGLGKGNAPFQ